MFRFLRICGPLSRYTYLTNRTFVSWFWGYLSLGVRDVVHTKKMWGDQETEVRKTLFQSGLGSSGMRFSRMGIFFICSIYATGNCIKKVFL